MAYPVGVVERGTKVQVAGGHLASTEWAYSGRLHQRRAQGLQSGTRRRALAASGHITVSDSCDQVTRINSRSRAWRVFVLDT